MRLKLAIAFFTGAALTLSAIVVAGVLVPSARAQDLLPDADDSAVTMNDDPWAIFGQIRLQIVDDDMRNFYDKLIASYELPVSSGNVTEQDPTMLPDIQKIQQVAITLPLQEAGARIRDPEIAAFYRNFLIDAGFGTLDTPQQ